MAKFYYKHSVATDDGSVDNTPKLRFWAPMGILVFAMTSTFAAFDWMMSLEPHWFSTMFGVYYFGGTVVAIFSILTAVSISLQKRGFLEDVITTEHYHDMGKMMFAFTVFWAYIAFSQYMLIWYANIPEETAWFQMRMEGSWFYFSMFLCVGHFGLPFFFLMGRTIKRIRTTIFAGAIWMLIMHYVDMFFIVQPTLSHFHGGHGFSMHIADLTTFVGIGGVVLSLFVKRLVAEPMVPTGDPRLQESLAFENF
ncbi:MAG: hypothetical protein VX938_13685 [Myxococcota bacterium]|nr:hypothetical protein [Myxococcota bacterium]